MRTQTLPAATICRIRLGVRAGRSLSSVLKELKIKDDSVVNDYLQIKEDSWPSDQVMKLHIGVQDGKSLTSIIREEGDITDEQLREYIRSVKAPVKKKSRKKLPADRKSGANDNVARSADTTAPAPRHGCLINLRRRPSLIAAAIATRRKAPLPND